MSNSYRKNPFVKHCSRSEKEWRTIYNRKLRHHNKIRLKIDPYEFEPMTVFEVSDVWTSPSDGKYYIGNMSYYIKDRLMWVNICYSCESRTCSKHYGGMRDIDKIIPIHNKKAELPDIFDDMERWKQMMRK